MWNKSVYHYKKLYSTNVNTDIRNHLDISIIFSCWAWSNDRIFLLWLMVTENLNFLVTKLKMTIIMRQTMWILLTILDIWIHINNFCLLFENMWTKIKTLNASSKLQNLFSSKRTDNWGLCKPNYPVMRADVTSNLAPVPSSARHQWCDQCCQHYCQHQCQVFTIILLHTSLQNSASYLTCQLSCHTTQNDE